MRVRARRYDASVLEIDDRIHRVIMKAQEPARQYCAIATSGSPTCRSCRRSRGSRRAKSPPPSPARRDRAIGGTNGLGQAVSATATTAADGTYSFSTDSHGSPIRPGTYQIVETTPTGDLAANVGTVNGATDGNEASATKITNIVMKSGQAGIDYDFGLSVPASVSGKVYLDMNTDGVFDTGDSGLAAAATVILTGTAADGSTINLQTTTDVNGDYIFTNLVRGTYTITLINPGGVYVPEVANVGTVNGTSKGVAGSPLEIDQVGSPTSASRASITTSAGASTTATRRSWVHEPYAGAGRA